MTNIPYADKAWNPVSGCSKISPGCARCWSETISHRFKRTTKPWTPANAAENVVLHPDRLDQPLHWRKPRTVAVCFTSDLFHPEVPEGFVDRVFAVATLTPWHRYLFLTKRAERLRDYMTKLVVGGWAGRVFVDGKPGTDVQFRMLDVLCGFYPTVPPQVLNRAADWVANHYPEADETFFPVWPLPNVYLGVSAENQHWADERIPLLLDTPAAGRWLSVEPMLGAVDLRPWAQPWQPGIGLLGRQPNLDWLVCGGESGPGYRDMNPSWAAALKAQCDAAGVPWYGKQRAARLPDQPLPGDLARRETPW